MKKYVFLILICICVTAGIMYYRVNNSVAKEYYCEEYNLNEYIKNDSSEFKVNSYNVSLEEGLTINITLNCNIKNISNISMDLSQLECQDILSIGGRTNDYFEIINYKDQYSDIPAGEEVNFEIVYSFYLNDLSEIEDNSEIRLDLGRLMYSEEVEDYFNKGKLYSKFIVLGRWVNNEV